MNGPGKPETAEERFARRNTLFRFWRSWPVTIGFLAGYGVFFVLQADLHWNAWAAAGMVIGAGVAIRVVKDVWPRKVPAELAGQVARMQAAGYRLRRRHLFLCTEKHPHVHLITPKGSGLISVWYGESPPPVDSSVRPGREHVLVIRRRHVPGDGGPG